MTKIKGTEIDRGDVRKLPGEARYKETRAMVGRAVAFKNRGPGSNPVIGNFS